MLTLFKSVCPNTESIYHQFELVKSAAENIFTFRCKLCGLEYSVPEYSLIPEERQLVNKQKVA